MENLKEKQNRLNVSKRRLKMNLVKKHYCDFCGCCPEEIIDGRTSDGRWAWMCKKCYNAVGRNPGKYGVGIAQKFINIKGGKKLEG